MKQKKNGKKLINKHLNLNDKKLSVGLLLVIFMAILFFITIARFESKKMDVKIGDIAKDDIRSTKEFEDEYQTNSLKADVSNNVAPKYRISPSIQVQMKDKVTTFLDTVRDVKLQNNISTSKKTDYLLESTDLELSKGQVLTALNMDFRTLNDFENLIIDLVNQMMGRGIKEEDLEYEKENLKETFDSLNLSEERKSLGLSLIYETIQPNETIDSIETERIRKEAVDKVKPVMVKQNDLIVQKGDRITEHKLSLIKASGLLKEDNKTYLKTYFGMGLLLFISIFFFVYYIYLFNYDILGNKTIILLLLVMILTIIISHGFSVISTFLIPISAGSLLISILIEPKLALVSHIFLVTFLGFNLSLDSNIIFMLILSGCIGVLTSTRQNQRYSVLLNGLYIGIVNILVITSFGIIQDLGFKEMMIKNFFGLINGILSGIIALGSLPLWENAFSILTPLRLLELSNPNQPLLRQLIMEAPGTYHHSLMVGNLSEAAAEVIGADPLLARVGSFYHDIGKIKRPYYFAENQFGMENPHDKLAPIQSANIIINHTLDGIQMAKSNKLPKEIIDIIEQHHGDTLVAYFYHKEKEKGKVVREEDFRYKGKRPQSKESALVMLADSTEAAVRSLKNPTKESIGDMASKVVKGKLDDGQLDECDLTRKNITNIIEIFTNALIGVYHDRIEYPDMETDKEVKTQ